MKITREHIILTIIFILVLGIRLALVLPAQGFSYEAYDSLRQAEHIKQTGTPLFKDELSYSGRTIIFPPLFYYILAGFSFIMPLELVGKLIPSLAFSSLVLIVYLIAKHLTKNRVAAITAAFFAGFIPILFTTLNQVSVYSFSLPLIFLLSYTFLRLEEKGFTALSITLTIILLLIHTSVLVLLISFLAYFLILIAGKQEVSKKKVETALFFFALALWFNLLLYKRAFFAHGITFIWQNIPAPLLSSYFSNISFFGVIYAVGAVTLLLGVYAIYHVFFKTKSSDTSLYMGFAIISFIMLWLRLAPFRVGLMFLSINLIILSAYSIKMLLVSIAKTKTPHLANWAIIAIISLFILTTLTPFIVTARLDENDRPSREDIQALEWIRENTDDGSVVLGRVEEGFFINYAAQRKNIADNNFLLMPDVEQRYNDILHLYTLRLKSEAIRLLNEYDINYIFLSTRTMQEFNMTKLFYAEDDCFKLMYEQGALVYKFLAGCEIE